MRTCCATAASVTAAFVAVRPGASQVTVTVWLNGAAAVTVTVRWCAAGPTATFGATPAVPAAAVQTAAAGSTSNAAATATAPAPVSAMSARPLDRSPLRLSIIEDNAELDAPPIPQLAISRQRLYATRSQPTIEPAVVPSWHPTILGLLRWHFTAVGEVSIDYSLELGQYNVGPSTATIAFDVCRVPVAYGYRSVHSAPSHTHYCDGEHTNRMDGHWLVDCLYLVLHLPCKELTQPSFIIAPTGLLAKERHTPVALLVSITLPNVCIVASSTETSSESRSNLGAVVHSPRATV